MMAPPPPVMVPPMAPTMMAPVMMAPPPPGMVMPAPPGYGQDMNAGGVGGFVMSSGTENSKAVVTRVL